MGKATATKSNDGRAQARKSVAKVVSESGIIDAKRESDTLRLWENYRDQAILWRSLSLLQIPATFIAVLFAIVLWHTRSIMLNVPERPDPGQYLAHEIPDSAFIDNAQNFVNLIATYQPIIARRQFKEARNMLIEPMLTKFEAEMLEAELKTIENTRRTQLFFVDPTETRVVRPDRRNVVVELVGDRLKIISGRELPPIKTLFGIHMTTVPRNTLNPYGIVIHNITAEKYDVSKRRVDDERMYMLENQIEKQKQQEAAKAAAK